MNLRELLLGHSQRLRYVVRFSTCHRVHDESVAEHSFYTALYTAMMCRGLEIQDEYRGKIDVARAIEGALIHDLEEARSGDFPRPFKYSDERLKQALDNASGAAAHQCFFPIFGTSWMTDRMLFAWARAKDKQTKEGCLVELADYLSVLSYIWAEVRGSNLTMREHLDAMREYHAMFQSARFDFVRSWVDESSDILEEVLG